MFGKEALLKGYGVIKEKEAEQRRQEEEAAGKERRTRLAGVLISAALAAVPSTHSGVTLDLSPRAAKKLIRAFDLPTDFPAAELKLKIRNDYDAWANFSPYINIPEQEVLYLPAFLAHRFGSTYSSEDGRIESATNLFIRHETGADIAPVEFKSDDYEYIRKIGGLFMPKATRITTE